MKSDLIVSKQEQICKIIINREDKRNAIRPQTWAELNELVEGLEKDKKIQVAIIRGAGDQSFASGADLREMEKRTSKDILESIATDVLFKIEQSRVVYIAAINGFALGGGCELAMACDIRIASEHAKFGQPEVNLSLIPAAGGTQRLPRLVGESVAKDMILSGRIINAQEALQFGLVSEVCPYQELDAVAEQRALAVASKGPLAIAFAKKIMNASMEQRGYLLEKLYQSYLLSTEDVQEGIAAFFEKRKPVYKGM